MHNPFGVVYNPISMAYQIQILLEKEKFRAEDLDFFNELWFSYAHYTLYSDPDKNTCLGRINSDFIRGKEFLRSADVIFLTLGTSFVYRLKESGRIVSNCHKIPAGNFERFISSIDNTVLQLDKAIRDIRKINPAVQFVFTVSPIRHWKDGAVNNQRSKAALILAIEQLQAGVEGIYYFPVYELFMDELRDYRFYADDMLHPSPLAIQLVWQRFSGTFIGKDSQGVVNEINGILTGLEHRPLHTSTKMYREFITGLKEKIDRLMQANPRLDFNEEQKLLNEIV
jgi:hypothetical protein